MCFGSLLALACFLLLIAGAAFLAMRHCCLPAQILLCSNLPCLVLGMPGPTDKTKWRSQQQAILSGHMQKVCGVKSQCMLPGTRPALF